MVLMDFKKKIVRKPVAFNTEDAAQRELLIYAMSIPNYSQYMKDLLFADYQKHLELQKYQEQLHEQFGDKLPAYSQMFKNTGGIKFSLDNGNPYPELPNQDVDDNTDSSTYNESND
jgi:hypothetical protein